MLKRFVAIMLILTSGLAPGLTQADAMEDITNFVRYSDNFASAGQPDADQLAAAHLAGTELVVYIGFSNSQGALAGEDAIVKNLGMDYVQIPVDFKSPTVEDFRAFAGVMGQNAGRNVLLHCQVNYRASAFAFLYRVTQLGADVDAARADMEKIWTPNETWSAFIDAVLSEFL